MSRSSFRSRHPHILSVKQFNRQDIDEIFGVASALKNQVNLSGSSNLLQGKVMSTMFYEPSTRTSSSFQAAMLRLGGSVIPIAGTKTSSVAKGETLEDTMRCLQSYSDCVVLRHPEIGSAKRAASVMRVPLLNAGDGAGEHPTQALLDAFTILSEVGRVDNLTITLLGDLKHGRTVHSLAYLLTNFTGITLNYVSPDFLKMPQYIKDDVKSRGIVQNEYTDLSQVLAQTDVLYVTRVQKERFVDKKQYEVASKLYCIGPDTLRQHNAKSTLRILHPLPRVNELSHNLDSDPRAAYFRQMEYGMYLRMALLALLLCDTVGSGSGQRLLQAKL